MAEKLFDAVGFDYNGTALDDAANFYTAVCVSIFDRYGVKRPTFDQHREEVSQDPEKMYLDRGIAAPWNVLQGHVTEYFAERENSPLTSGFRPMIRSYAKLRVPMALLTALATPIFKRELERHRIERYFSFIRSDLRNMKSAAMGECCEAFGCEPAAFVYAGDTPRDIIDARNAGCFVVACTWGYGSIRALRDEGPDLIVDSWREFREKVRFRAFK